MSIIKSDSYHIINYFIYEKLQIHYVEKEQTLFKVDSRGVIYTTHTKGVRC